MKRLPILLFVLLAQVATAQLAGSRLDHDPVFATVLSRRINYPVDAERLGIYAKIYAGFNIDEKGHIQHISILNPKKIGYGFEEEILKKVKLLPPVNPKYEGSYTLPVTFAFIDHNKGGKAISPAGELPIQYFKDRILLNELRVIGGRTVTRKDRMTTQSQGQVLTIEQ